VPDILHEFPVDATPQTVFETVSMPEGLDAWWTLRSKGAPALGAKYELFFGREYDWRARVTRCRPGEEFELELTHASDDWVGTRVGFTFEPAESGTLVRFRHSGWDDASEHFRVSSYCWAMYLRIMKRWLEYGETVAYQDRLDA